MRELTTARRAKIHKEACNLCAVCWTQPSESIDHIVPRALGGTHERSNLQAICTECHDAKTKIDRKKIDCVKREIFTRNTWKYTGKKISCEFSRLKPHTLCIYFYLAAHVEIGCEVNPTDVSRILFSDRGPQGVNSNLVDLELLGVLEPATVYARCFSEITYESHPELYKQILSGNLD